MTWTNGDVELKSSIRKLPTFQRAAPKEEKAILFHYVYDGKNEVLNVTSKKVPFMRRLAKIAVLELGSSHEILFLCFNSVYVVFTKAVKHC